ncbi:heavy metal-binding domain-containing protein [Pontimicrobium sp. SW4]|uniref:Heavy metal-binding domain-containing protein n=1 Tax=Pontimicrobium sp. SW4 TaxID=3153519 RepID=A0AAU7BQF2_9FLAO
MKKTLLILALMLSASTVLVSCKGEKKENNEEIEMTESHAADNADMAMNDVYQCPMDCEEGKTYDKEGNCPVCKMALKKVEGDNDEGDSEDHDDD